MAPVAGLRQHGTGRLRRRRQFDHAGRHVDLLCDRFGVQPCGKDALAAFEAAWGRDGAICVAHPRIAENVSREQLAERYPRLKSHLGPATCNEDSAMRDPAALLFNRSGK